MKTIKDICLLLGLSRQQLYNIVKNKGLSLDDFTTERQGKTRLFDEKAVERLSSVVKCSDNVSKDNDNIVIDNATTLAARIKELEQELARTKEQLTAAQATIDEQKIEIERQHEENRVLLFTNANLSETVKRNQEPKLIEPAAQTREPAKGIRGKIKAAIRGWLEVE